MSFSPDYVSDAPLAWSQQPLQQHKSGDSTSERGDEESQVLEEGQPEQTQEATGERLFTQEELQERIGQEKRKLYDDLTATKARLRELEQAEAARAEAQAAEEARQAEEERRQREEEMSFKELLQTKEQEFQQQLAQERQERERAFAELQREREYARLQQYRAQRVEESRDSILPELIDLVAGNSEEEIEASIRGLQERSSRILASSQQGAQAARRETTGARVTSPPVEPLDAYSGTQSLTAEQIRDMPMEEYEQFRRTALGKGANSAGMFG